MARIKACSLIVGLRWRGRGASSIMARHMAEGDSPTSPARATILAFCSGVQLTAIRAVVLRFWLPLPLMMRIQSARLGRGAAHRRFAERERESPALEVHGGHEG